jgi:hypothetical protein
LSLREAAVASHFQPDVAIFPPPPLVESDQIRQQLRHASCARSVASVTCVAHRLPKVRSVRHPNIRKIDLISGADGARRA